MKLHWLRRGVATAGAAMLVATMPLVAGCGDGDSDEPEVTLRITRDFGRELLAGETLPLDGHQNALALLRESHTATLSDFGSVYGIDDMVVDLEADESEAKTWALNLNGVETDAAARDLQLVDGDVVQFDLRDWYVTRDVRATVGAFPQPFAGGVLGVRFPVHVRCAPGYDIACQEVRAALRKAGVDPSGRSPRQPPATARLKAARELQSVVGRAVVLVGPWKHWRERKEPSRIDRGTRYSGVFARFSPDAASLRLLDFDENVVRSSGPGSGLVAAMRPTDDLLWLVTGVDREGVGRAARAFDADALRDAFAIAITDAGVEKLPLPGRGRDGTPVAVEFGSIFPGRMLVRGVRSGLPDADGPLYEFAAGDAPSRLGDLRCRRVHASPAGPVLCLRVASNGFDYEALVIDGALRPVARRRVEGVPSRARVSRDGRYGAFTTFAAEGQSYFADTSEFSAATRIVDMRTGEVLLRLERLKVRRGGKRLDVEGAELWGVAFGDDGRFYATLARAGETEHLLIEGRVGSRRARVVADRIECPSLSPDGTRIAYKRRIGDSNRWRLHVRDIAGGRDLALSETRSIDDQPEWLGDGRVAYSDGESVYAVRADGRGEPQLLARRATSPVWIPPPGG